MMRVATIVVMALAMATTTVHAGNIDKDGFTMDGVATYCQGLSKDASTFSQLQSNSLNRCPVLVNITPGATTIHKNDPLEVKFQATAKFGDIPGNIFPRAIIDQNAKKVLPVTSSYMKWCKAGTNCDKPMDATPFGTNAPTGDFDATGSKTLQSFRFTFTDPGDYIIFGQVTLPGDAQLNVSGQQFVTFQKITVVETSVSIAPSPSPTPNMASSSPSSAPPTASNNSSTSNNKTSGSVSDESAVVPVKSTQDKTNGPSASEIPTEGAQTKAAKSSGSSSGTIIGIIIGACVVVGVLGYVVVMRRKKNEPVSKANREKTPTFRMSSGNEHMGDPEPTEYISTKTMRNTGLQGTTQQSLPILGAGGASTSSTDDGPMEVAKRGSDLNNSFDDHMDSSFDEGTVTASNKAISTKPPKPSSRPSSNNMAPSSLYDDRDTALYQEGQTVQQERDFYQSESGWDAAASGHSYAERETSMISINDDGNSHRGFAMPSFTSETIGDVDFEEGRVSRFNSEASVDSYAFRPSRTSIAESYQSRVSRYSYDDSELDRDSSRISGMSMFSDRGTNV